MVTVLEMGKEIAPLIVLDEIDEVNRGCKEVLEGSRPDKITNAVWTYWAEEL